MTHELRILRQASSPAERVLWQALRRRQAKGHKVRRQAIVGGTVMPFVFSRARLALALHHGTTRTAPSEIAQLNDAARRSGYRLLWLHDTAVLEDLETVLQRIDAALARGG